ncbi:MAG: hypothetical protein OEZ48_01520 [Candidatus Bathyarchaeota archaeon]|nr:hypothetical protein [Candidatus Bathyarchaeota archaeon]
MSAEEPIRWKVGNAYGFLDMLIATLCEHEKRLSDLIDSLAEELAAARKARETDGKTGRKQSETERSETVLRYYEDLADERR